MPNHLLSIRLLCVLDKGHQLALMMILSMGASTYKNVWLGTRKGGLRQPFMRFEYVLWEGNRSFQIKRAIT